MISLPGTAETMSGSRRFNPTPWDRGSSFIRLLCLEVRRSQGVWLVPLMVFLGLFISTTYSNDGVVFWDDLNNRTVMSFVTIGPLAAALAAWLAGRNRRRRLVDLTAMFPGSGIRLDLLAWLTASFWGGTGYAIVGGWLGWQGLRNATWGGPDLMLLLTGFLGIAFFTVIGVGSGRLVNSRFAPLLALIVTTLLIIGSDAFKIQSEMGGFHQPLKMLLPWGLVSNGYPDVFYGSLAPFAREMTVWLMGLTGVVLALLAMLRLRTIGAFAMLAVSVAVAGVGAVNLVRPDAEPWSGTVGQPVPFEWSCQTRSQVEVCVHPAWNSLLDEIGAQVAAMVAPVAGLDGVSLHWKQSYPGWADESDYEMLPQIGTDFVAWAVADAIFPTGPGDGGGPVAFRPASQLVILQWMLSQSGGAADTDWPFGWPKEIPRTEAVEGGGFFYPAEPDHAALSAIEPEFRAAVDRFALLSADEQRAWLEKNWDALRAGNIDLDEMP